MQERCCSLATVSSLVAVSGLPDDCVTAFHSSLQLQRPMRLHCRHYRHISLYLSGPDNGVQPSEPIQM